MKQNNKYITLINNYIDLNKQLIDQEVNTAIICSDPMNGCPGDFAEAGAIKARSIQCKIWPLVLDIEKLPKGIQARVNNQICAYYNKAMKSYYNQPWNW